MDQKPDKLRDLVNGVDSEARQFKGTFEEYQNLRANGGQIPNPHNIPGLESAQGSTEWQKPASDVVENSPSEPRKKAVDTDESSSPSSVEPASAPSETNGTSFADEVLAVPGMVQDLEPTDPIKWDQKNPPMIQTLYSVQTVGIPGSDPIRQIVEHEQVRTKVPGSWKFRFIEGKTKGESFDVAGENLDEIKNYILTLDDIIEQLQMHKKGLISKVNEKLEELPKAKRLARKQEFEFIHSGKTPRAVREPKEKKESKETLGFDKRVIDGIMKNMKTLGVGAEGIIEMLRKKGTLTPEIADYVEKNFGGVK